MPVNASPEYGHAEKEYHLAKTTEEKIEKLKKMLSVAPKHKSSENLIKQLRTRLKKLQGEIERTKKLSKSRGGKTGIKKSEMQAVIVGFSRSGKSSLLNVLTNANARISEARFTTTHPIIGMMSYGSTQIQLIEIPAIDSEFYDKGTVYTADSILILIQNLEELKKIEPLLQTQGKKIIVLNKSDLLSELEKRKLEATLKSKYKNYEFVFISCLTSEGIKELKEKIFKSFNKIRIYTKEPGKQKSENPIILEPETTIKEVAEKILKGFSEKVKETKIWGPSSKFPGQKVGLKHKLKDLDVVEFKTR
ncbi:50S ribosome-binding GTPase [Candidatus Pacearchaeota archaeon]|nr:50S ribosome-binding GTPase [Candidatus Pacearchaeota archaeon]